MGCCSNRSANVVSYKSLRLSPPGEQELQHGSDAFGPGVFAVMAAWNLVIFEVLARPPAFPDEHSLQHTYVRHGAVSFVGPDTQPGVLPGLLSNLLDILQNPPPPPPHRRKMHRQLPKHAG